MSKKIFYLDDDLDDLYLFKEAAESIGHSVTIFVNGNEMLRALNGTDLPDIIFLDIRMPVFNGEEILHIIKKNPLLADIPVVMISGFSPKSLVRTYLEAGASYLMKKPDVMSDYRSALEQVLKIDWKTFQAFS
ncbi:MAG: response regulator [Flavobacterium sp.]|nr:response regulator [Flavobacterium sp.]